MLISRSKKLLFIHIQKTGGTSIGAALRKAVPDTENILCAHDHARWAREHLGNEYDEFFKFAFVRNPWDRLVSWYRMIVAAAQTRGPRVNDFWHYVLTEASTFEEFLLRCTATIDGGLGRRNILYNQIDYLTNDASELIVDFVGRFEQFEADVHRLFAQRDLGPVHLAQLNKSPHEHYSCYYSSATRDLVGERFARDIAWFGYRFETPE